MIISLYESFAKISCTDTVLPIPFKNSFALRRIFKKYLKTSIGCIFLSVDSSLKQINLHKHSKKALDFSPGMNLNYNGTL